MVGDEMDGALPGVNRVTFGVFVRAADPPFAAAAVAINPAAVVEGGTRG